MTKLHHLTVVDGDQELRMAIGQQRVDQFEMIVGPIYSTLQSILTGSWTYAKIRSVISWAHPGGMVAGGEYFDARSKSDITGLLEIAGRVLQAQLHGLSPEEARIVRGAA